MVLDIQSFGKRKNISLTDLKTSLEEIGKNPNKFVKIYVDEIVTAGSRGFEGHGFINFAGAIQDMTSVSEYNPNESHYRKGDELHPVRMSRFGRQLRVESVQSIDSKETSAAR